MSDKSFGEMLRELDDLFEDEYDEFVDDFIENKARPHIMMYLRDWFDEQVSPSLREKLQDQKPAQDYAKRLAGFLTGIREGVEGFMADLVGRYVDVPNFTVTREPFSGDELSADELDEEALTLLAAIQHSIDNHNYEFLNQGILTDITGYNSNLVFDKLRLLEDNGFIERVLPDYHPPGIHHLQKRYDLKKRLDDPESVVDPLSVNDVMVGVAEGVADNVRQETEHRGSQELLDALREDVAALRDAPLETRQEARTKIHEHLD